jgi:hypothetical protein
LVLWSVFEETARRAAAAWGAFRAVGKIPHSEELRVLAFLA